MFEIGYVFNLILLIPLILLFIYSPFRPSQFFLLFIVFSFGFKGVAVTLCDNFNHNYIIFNFHDYYIGLWISFLISLTFIFGYFLNVKKYIVNSGNNINETSLIDIYNYAVLSVTFAVIIYVLAFLKYGLLIVPGFRQGGLSLSAPGSQVYYALISALCFFSVSLSIYLIWIKGINKKLLVLFLLSCVVGLAFYQRGHIIAGIFFGLFMGISTYRRSDLFKIGGLLGALFFIAIYARKILSFIGSYIFNGNENIIEEKSSLVCSIANSASQDHDQVWAVIIDYINHNGYLFFDTLLSSIVRPFLSAEDRMNLFGGTSIDVVNIYNNSEVYLNYNYGFSFNPIQFYFLLFGFLSIPMFLIFGIYISKTENHMMRELSENGLNRFNVIKIYSSYLFITLILSILDEKIKWVILFFVVIYSVVNIKRVLNVNFKPWS